MRIPQPLERRKRALDGGGVDLRHVVNEGELDRRAEKRERTPGEETLDGGPELRAQAGKRPREGGNGNRSHPDANRRMNRRTDAEQEGARAKPDIHTFEYLELRIIPNPFTSSAIPSSRLNAGRYPVRSTFSFEMM